MIIKRKIDVKIRTMYFHGSCLIIVARGVFGLISSVRRKIVNGPQTAP